MQRWPSTGGSGAGRAAPESGRAARAARARSMVREAGCSGAEARGRGWPETGLGLCFASVLAADARRGFPGKEVVAVGAEDRPLFVGVVAVAAPDHAGSSPSRHSRRHGRGVASCPDPCQATERSSDGADRVECEVLVATEDQCGACGERNPAGSAFCVFCGSLPRLGRGGSWPDSGHRGGRREARQSERPAVSRRSPPPVRRPTPAAARLRHQAPAPTQRSPSAPSASAGAPVPPLRPAEQPPPVASAAGAATSSQAATRRRRLARARPQSAQGGPLVGLGGADAPDASTAGACRARTAGVA